MSVQAKKGISVFPRLRHRHGGERDRTVRTIAANAALWPDATAFALPDDSPSPHDSKPAENSPIKVLLVNAHPDDESESAGVVYRISHELGGTVDQVVITNGEGGYQYSAPAEAFYRLPLTNPTDGRQLLSQIRREELMRSSRILGIRDNYFLDQTDTGATLRAEDAFDVWDVARIRQELRTLLEFGGYNVILLLLPTAKTHGHHQTVAAITLDVLNDMAPEDRPAAVGVQTTSPAEGFSELGGYALTRTTSSTPAWQFDRRTPLACHPTLDYSIVVNWAIAEHKTQGLFQLENARRTHEHFWLFSASGETGAAKWSEFLKLLELGTSEVRLAQESVA